MRILFHAIAVVVGAAVSVAAVAVHRTVVLHLPIGLLLALSATLVTCWAMREMLPGLATSYSLGWLVVFGLSIAGRPEGDYAVMSDPRGYVLVAAAFVMLVLGVVSLSQRGRSSLGGAT